MLRLLTAALLALALPLAASANALVESIQGEARVGGAPISQGQRLFAGSSIDTAPGAQLALRFDDGMQVVVGENSLLRLVDFSFAKGQLADRVVLDLLKGNARVATGAIARKNPKEFYFRTPQAQFGVQGPADFSVVLVNPAFLTVNAGTVLASNAAGTVAFGAGATATVASSSALAAPLAASSFPASASSAFGNLQAAAVAAPGGAAGGAVAGVAVGGTGLGVAGPILFFGAAVAGAAGALKSGDDPAAVTHH